MPILVMLREHGNLWHLMDTLTELLDDNAPDDWLLATCRELLAQLDQHDSKEESIIYPHSQIDLTADAAPEPAEFLRTGSTPDGWALRGSPVTTPAAPVRSGAGVTAPCRPGC